MMKKQDEYTELCYPFSCNTLLRKQKSLRRKMLARKDIKYIDKRIAILGGSTISDFKNLLEIFLLDSNIRPIFYESDYNKYYEEAVFQNNKLESFAPDIVIIFTSVVNIVNEPVLSDDITETKMKLQAEYKRYEAMWTSLFDKYSAIVIQNNFDPPPFRPEGSLDATLPQSMANFVDMMNAKFVSYATSHDGFFIHDLARVASEFGISQWHNRFHYYAYKFAMDYDAIPNVAWSMSRLIRAMLGKTKKVLILDLDNTLWGGVIGDDGRKGIELGYETPLGEAFIEWQKYIKHLKNRGVLLAVCSKNEEENAKEGFSHPDSVLGVDDFVAFYANWNPKSVNILQIAKELNLGLDSFVFIDDNPMERAIVRQTLPEVAVPEVDPQDISSYIKVIEGNGYFDTISLSADDFQRSQTYHENRQREALATSVATYDDFLKTLQMEAEVGSFCDIYLDRIAQLTNKTNQFNLTTRRHTVADIREMMDNEKYITLYCRLKDKFGDNGLVSEIVAEKRGEEAHILLWLMSCRVLKRDVESLMLDELVARSIEKGCEKVVGYYFPTQKNKMVADIFKQFGFSLREKNSTGTIWELPLKKYNNKNRFIHIYNRESII